MRDKKGKTGGRATEKGIGHSSRIQEEKHTKKMESRILQEKYKGKEYGKSATLRIDSTEIQGLAISLLRELCLASRDLVISVLMLSLKVSP